MLFRSAYKFLRKQRIYISNRQTRYNYSYLMKKGDLLMNTLNRYTAEYLSYCEYRKRLNFKTLKAYRIDLNQYSVFCNSSMDFLSRNTLDLYITELHKHYKPKSVKRKIASLKAFFHYLQYADLLVQNPFGKLEIGRAHV